MRSYKLCGAAKTQTKQRKLSHSPGRGGRPGEFCIFFKLSNSGLALGAWREVGDEAVPAAGEVKVKED